MTLKQIGEEYLAAAAPIRERVKLLRRELDESAMSETDRFVLKRRICLLDSMARQTAATGRYLVGYYRVEEGENDACGH